MCAFARQHLSGGTGLEPRAELGEAGSPFWESGQRAASLDVMKGIDMMLIIRLGAVLWNIGAMNEQQDWGKALMLQM